MTVLRIGTPEGEVVIRGGNGDENRRLFEAFQLVGWPVEERHARDYVVSAKGWIGEPIRRANMNSRIGPP